MAVERIEQSVDDRGRTEWPRGVMDEDDSGRDRLQAVTNAFGPRCSADDRLAGFQPVQRRARFVFLALADHHPHRVDPRMADQCLDRVAEHRLAADRAILLGHAAAQALTASSGDNEGGDGHGTPSRRANLARQEPSLYGGALP